VAKGLDAFFAQERGQGPPAPHPDTRDNEAPVLPFFAPQDASDAPHLPAPGRPDPDINVMLSALETSADREPRPSVVRHVPAPDDRTPAGPVLVHQSEPHQPAELESSITSRAELDSATTSRAELDSAITSRPELGLDQQSSRAKLASILGEFGLASRFASGLESRTKDYLGSARSNFTRPVFKQKNRRRKSASLRFDAHEAAVIALSIVGLAEVGWIGWRVANQPKAAVVVNRGPKSSEASQANTTVPAPRGTRAPAQRSLPPKSTPPASAPAKNAPAPASATSAPAPSSASVPSKSKGQVPAPLPTAGRTASPRATSPVALNVAPGSVNVNALPWASVTIDGAPVGDTPLANLPLAAGPHDVVFKHPELGERRLKVNVTAGTPLRVTTDLRSK
jgi:PEGA domain